MGASVFVMPVVQKLQVARTCPAGASRRDPGRGEQAGHPRQPAGRGDRQGRRHRGRDPGGGPTIPAPAGRDRGVHKGGAGRRAALDRRPADHRGDHPGPHRVRLRGGGRGRALDDQPGSGTGHLPAAGHPGRRYVFAGPRPARGGPGASRTPRSPRRGPGSSPSRPDCWPRRRSPRRSRNLALKQAAIQAEIDAAKAQSAAAGPLAEAERQQCILAEQQKVAERNAELKQRQLDTEVRKPADAERYRVEQEAEARKNAAIADADARRQATIAAAQASAEQSRLTGEGERSRRAALAEANASRAQGR